MSLTPEASEHTSIKQRVAHVRRMGELGKLRAAVGSSVPGSLTCGDLEQDHWLVPVEDRRAKDPQSREAMLGTFSLGSYLMLAAILVIGCVTAAAIASPPRNIRRGNGTSILSDGEIIGVGLTNSI